jgi:murein L,D-transpeptidase YafK
MHIAPSAMNTYNSLNGRKLLFQRRMTRYLRVLTAAAALVCAMPLAHSDSISEAGRVSMRPPAKPTQVMADRVVVRKAERRLYLMRGESVLRSYRIALGLNPVGHKERSGDFRTPEGKYRLTRRNPRSDFFLSIQVSYPNDADMKRARRNGWDAGGSIMIHGLPNQLKRTPEYYESRDWTDGCIAVSNSDMVEIWLLTPDNAPIEILP